MERMIHTSIRKLKTFGLTVAKCSNWPSIALTKLGYGAGPEIIHFRDRFKLKPVPPLRATWGEIFEPAIADLYNFGSATPDLVIDVGANMGSFACRAAYLQPAATIHAFEPSEKHGNFLDENIRLNNLHNVTLHREAVTKDGREVTFSEHVTGGSSSIFFQHANGASRKLKSTSLAVIDFSKSKSLFLKLDCEGAEGEIIEWVCEHSTELPPRIRIAAEWHHWCPISREESIRLLRANGFVAEGQILFDESYLFASRSPAS